MNLINKYSKFINRNKGITTLISAILIHLLIGNIFTFSNLIPYYESYLHYARNSSEIPLKKLNYIAPTGLLFNNALPSVTGFLDDILGTRLLIIIGSISLLVSNLIMYFTTSYFLMIISYILFGFCGSLTYFQTLRNCWKYFPNKKGLISGIIFSCFGLSAFIFTGLGDLIISKGSDLEKKNNYYCKETAMKYLNYLKFYIICIIIMGTLSSILCFPYKEDNNINNDNEETIINKGKEEENYSDEIKEGNKKDNDNLTLKESIFSLDFALCLTLAFCTLIFGFLLTNTYRVFGSRKKLNDSALKALSLVFTLLNTFTRLLWGIIYDKFGFKIPYIIVCINQIICGILIYPSSRYISTYFIVACFGVLSFSGHVVLFPNLVQNKFGVENSVNLLGICGIFVGISSMVGPTIISNTEDFLKVYLIGVSPTVVSLIVTIFIKVDKLKKKVSIVYPQESESDQIVNNNLTKDASVN